MDDRSFAQYLSAWLDPYELLNAAERYDRDRDGALAPASLHLSSGRLTFGAEANFAAMVEKYLRGFRLPPPMVDLVRASAGASPASSEAWDWLRDLAASTKLRNHSHGDTPPGIPPTIILQIDDCDVILDIVKQPLMALLELVSVLAITWRENAATGASFYHKQTMPNPFYAYVDFQVASAYLDLVDTAQFARGAPKMRYRAVTIVGVPDNSRLWDAAQEMAREAAATTLQPIRTRLDDPA